MTVELVFCTYFKRIERFRYEQETYGEYVAFCVKQGCFGYQIGEEAKETVCDGEIVICPPGQRFSREIIEPVELCMIKFKMVDASFTKGKRIKVSNLLRWNEDLDRLQRCLFCDTLFNEPLYSHYCMDIIYMAMESTGEDSKISLVKKSIDQNYNSKALYISELARQVGYTVPHLINKFKRCYGMTPKAYLSCVRIQKAKELLLSTDMLSREIAFALGFEDELYFIRFFKKHAGTTPRHFRERGL